MRDIYRVQEPYISLFRRSVPQFYMGTPGLVFRRRKPEIHRLESSDRAYTLSHKLTPEIHFQLRKLKKTSRIADTVRAGYLLQPFIGCGKRIGYPNRFFSSIRKKSSESNRGIEYTD